MSKFVTLHGFGGSGIGGTNLNFDIVDGTTAHENPTENMIWVNTDVGITGYYFSSVEPENMSDGEVWFLTGTHAQTSFNALKEDNVMVYPLSTKQMVSGSLVSKTAKIYQNGAWIEWWDGTLYDSGTHFTNITGGFVKSAYGTLTGTYTEYDDRLYIRSSSSSSSGRCVYVTKNKIDLSGYNSIEFDAKLNLSRSNRGMMVVTNGASCATYIYTASSVSNTRTTYTLDISGLTGEYEVGFGVWHSESSAKDITVYRIKLI